MSTKIYDGFRLPDTTLEAALGSIHAFRPRIATLRRALSGKLLAEAAVELIDRGATQHLGGDATPEAAAAMPLRHALDDLQRRALQIESQRRRDVAIDHGFEICLLPFNGDILGISFCEQRSWCKDWMEHSSAEPFSYWNSTDAPEGISETEWAARGAVWDAALSRDPSGRPGYAGLTAHLSEIAPDFLMANEVLEFVPDLDTRAQKRARSLLRDRKFVETFPEGVPENVPMSEISRALFAIGTYFESPEGDTALCALADELRPLLPMIDEARLIGG